MKNIKLLDFNPEDYLKTEEQRARFLEMSLVSNEDMGEATVEGFQQALETVAKSRKITKTKLAKTAKLSRQSVQGFFTKGTRPRLDTFLKMVDALDLEISFHPKKSL